jgi:hypothetical protein
MINRLAHLLFSRYNIDYRSCTLYTKYKDNSVLIEEIIQWAHNFHSVASVMLRTLTILHRVVFITWHKNVFFRGRVWPTVKDKEVTLLVQQKLFFLLIWRLSMKTTCCFSLKNLLILSGRVKICHIIAIFSELIFNLLYVIIVFKHNDHSTNLFYLQYVSHCLIGPVLFHIPRAGLLVGVLSSHFWLIMTYCS